MGLNKRETKINEFQAWLADWMNQTEPGSDLSFVLNDADDVLDLLFEAAGEEKEEQKKVTCMHCGTPIIKDENGIWINPDSPDDLPMVQCAGEPREWHNHYEEEK